MMKTMPKNHPLVGTWITADEDSDVAVVIRSEKGKPLVECFTRSEGVFLEITDLSWDGQSLVFQSMVPSSGWKTRHVFRISPDGTADVEFTWLEVWKKINATPGEIPEAWHADIINENLIEIISCHDITSEAQFWDRYIQTVKPEWEKEFEPSIEGFWGAINGGPGWPRECTLVFTGVTQLESIDNGKFLAELRRIARDSKNSLVPVQLSE